MKKITRSRQDKVIAGVCGGFAQYFNIDPTIIRIAWVVFAFASFGTFALAYLVCAIIIPEDDNIIYQDSDGDREYSYSVSENTPLFIGGALILTGAYLIAKIFYPWLHISLRNIFRFWPVLLILLGLYIIYNHKKEI